MVDDQLRAHILDKAELRGVSSKFADKIIEQYLQENPKTEQRMQTAHFLRSKEYKAMKKAVRGELRKFYGVFFADNYANKKEQYITKLIDNPTQENAREVLNIHRSTQERIEAYDFLYKQLFSYITPPESILDLGCGFNPYSYPFLPGKPEYHCKDIACDDLNDISRFLEKVAPNHTTECVDLADTFHINTFPEVDCVFAFKLFDSLEDRSRNITQTYLDSLNAQHIIVSFPLASISGKNSIKEREWFDKIVTKREIVRVTLPNEQFIIVTGKKKAIFTDTEQ